jgi:hypothetical protein
MKNSCPVRWRHRPTLAGGPLRLVPFVLGGDVDIATSVGEAASSAS